MRRYCQLAAAEAYCVAMRMRTACYAALLPRRGPHIPSHSVCLSVCLSVRPSRYHCHSNIGHVFSSTLRTCGIFCFVYMSGPHIVRRSQPHKLVLVCFYYKDLKLHDKFEGNILTTFKVIVQKVSK